MEPHVRSMTPADAEAVSRLADRLVGLGYYPPALVLDYLRQATTPEGVFAYVAEDAETGRPVAFRIALPPGRWQTGRGHGITPERWPAPIEETAYFQSCFVDEALMGRGIGRLLAERALSDLRRAGARAVVAHSWKESPHGSSFRYLSRLGFEAVREHPGYWSDVDYVCKRDGKPCRCTAIEMVLDLARHLR